MNQNDRLDEPELNREPPGAGPEPGLIDPETLPGNGRHRGSNTGWRVTFLAVLGGIFLVLSLLTLSLYSADKGEQAKATDITLGELAGKVAEACANNPVEARKTFGDVCGEAKVIDERPPGEKGDEGPKGDKGDKGDPGTPCVPENPACRGPRGPVGATGKAGPTPACMLLPSKCVGAVGPGGPVGPMGPQGPKGDTGEQGVEGPIGQAGSTGPQGPEGPIGPTGPKGDTGEKGDKGDDLAAQRCTEAGGEFKTVSVSGDNPETIEVEPMVTISTCVLK